MWIGFIGASPLIGKKFNYLLWLEIDVSQNSFVVVILKEVGTAKPTELLVVSRVMKVVMSMRIENSTKMRRRKSEGEDNVRKCGRNSGRS